MSIDTLGAASSITTREATDQILAILQRIPTQNLPKFTDKDGCIWFKSLSMGWMSSSHPEAMAQGQIATLLASESASREFLRRLSEPA